MSETAAKLLEQVLALPEADQRVVADRLWDELGYDPWVYDDPWDDPEFVALIEARMDRAEKHPEAAVDGPTFMAQLRDHLRRQPPAGLPEMPHHFADESEAEAAWQEELNRRLEAVANGTAELIPWDEAMAEMRAELARRREARQKGTAP